MAEETQTLTAEEAEQIRDIGTSRETSKQSDDQTPMRPLKYPMGDINRYGARVTFVPRLITGPKLDGNFSLGDILKVANKSLASVKSSDDFSKKDEEKVQENLNGLKSYVEKRHLIQQENGFHLKRLIFLDRTM